MSWFFTRDGRQGENSDPKRELKRGGGKPGSMFAIGYQILGDEL
jgi:hypothetical protein